MATYAWQCAEKTSFEPARYKFFLRFRCFFPGGRSSPNAYERSIRGAALNRKMHCWSVTTIGAGAGRDQKNVKALLPVPRPKKAIVAHVLRYRRASCLGL
jgi:hypothetical protein